MNMVDFRDMPYARPDVEALKEQIRRDRETAKAWFAQEKHA